MWVSVEWMQMNLGQTLSKADQFSGRILKIPTTNDNMKTSVR